MTSSLATQQEVACAYPSTIEERHAIRAQMERILASPHFRQSKRYPVLLRYIVEQTLEGHASELKERTLGMEVFQREADYDTNLDPVVRITAGEVRKRIAQYYHDSGHLDEPRIDLPAGSYVPQFRLATGELRQASQERNHSLPASSIPPEQTIEVVAPLPRPGLRWRRTPALAAGASLAALFLAVGAWMWLSWQRGGKDAVWAPFFTSSPLLISMGEPSLVFDRDPGARQEPLSVREHLHVVDYMVFSDVQALTRVTGLLDSHRQPYRLLPASATTYADLRQGPALLLGGFDNPWTMRATSTLRFRLMRHPGDDQLWIEDQKDPQARRWAVNFAQRYDSLLEDYAIVARFMDPDTHQPVLILAGVGENGTKAASELLTDSASGALRAITDAGLRGVVGKDWAGQNFEAVVRTRVINGVSGPPIVLAKEVW